MPERNMRKNARGEWVLRVVHRGREFTKNTYLRDRRQAVRVRDKWLVRVRSGELLRELEAEKNRTPTVGEFFERWLAGPVETNRNAKGVALARQRMEHHTCPVLGDVRLDRITVEHGHILRKAVVSKRRRGGKRNHLGPQTANHVVTDLLGLVIFANDLGLINRVPALKKCKAKIPERPCKALTSEETRAVQRHAGHHRPTVDLLLGTALRWGEAHKLTWRDVHLEDRKITLRTQKNGKVGVVWLDDLAVGALEQLKAKTWNGPDSFVVPERSKNAQGWTKYIVRRCGFHWTAHQLRHTSAKVLLEDSGSREVIRRHLRQSTLRMTETYAEADEAWVRNHVTSRRWNADSGTEVGNAKVTEG